MTELETIKILGKAFEDEDIKTLELLSLDKYAPIEQAIIKHILDTRDFSAASILPLGIDHAARYMELCNKYVTQKKDI